MLEQLSSSLLLKATLVPALIVIASMIERYYGPKVAGFFSGFPIVAAPISWILTHEYGDSFGIIATQNTVIGMLPLILFGVVYVLASFRYPPKFSLLAASVVYAFSIFIVYQLTVPFWLSCLLVLGAIYLSREWLRRKPLIPNPLTIQISPFIRAGAGFGLVVVLAVLGSTLGPKLAGVFTPFPVITSVLLFFWHRAGGYEYCRLGLQGLLNGLVPFLIFFVCAALLLPQLGSNLAYMIALMMASIALIIKLRFI